MRDGFSAPDTLDTSRTHAAGREVGQTVADVIADNDAEGVPVSVAVSAQGFPDGRVWVGVEFNTPLNKYVAVFPPEQAEEMADKLPEGLRNAAAEARDQASQQARKRSGIALPGDAGFTVPRQAG